ncbi:MAG: ABC transporter permease [Thermoanaerobaculia bacterium]|nr:ABC transporter permease [Thermoanaerobaculia bacterium]
MSRLLRDFRFAFRSLFQRPVLTSLAVLTLALGIGANTAIFSLINGFVLQPLPWHESDKLVQVWNTYPLMNLPQATVSIPDYLDRREGVAAFEESALYTFGSFNLTEDGSPERVIGLRTTWTLFPLLGATAAEGRVFGAQEDQPGADQVVILSHGLWQRRYGGDEGLVGRDIRISGDTYRVLGIMPENFFFPNERVELWRPYAFTEEETSDDRRGFESSFQIARLAAGANLVQAQQQIDAIHEANKERFPEAKEFWENSGFGGYALSLRDEFYGELRPRLLLVQAVVAFVLLIACANVAHLLLTRMEARRRELAVRSALGAGRWELARQILVEGMALAAIGAATGLALGIALLQILAPMAMAGNQRPVDLGLDASVLGFTALLAVVTAVIFSLFPVLSVWRTRPMEVIKEGGRGASGASSWPRRFLVVAEVTLATTLLVGAGLLLRTFQSLQAEDPGLRTENVLTAQVSLADSKYPEDPTVVSFYEQVLDKLDAVPGVASAGMISAAPFSGSSSSGSYLPVGYEVAEGESAPHAFQRVVDEDFFATVDIALVRGRGFERGDNADAEPVVVVDQLLVDKYFQDQEPLGAYLARGGGADDPRFRIVGIVETVKTRTLDQPVTKETIYYPHRQAPRRSMSLVLATDVAPSSVTEALRQAVREVDPQQPLYGITTISEQLLDRLRPQRVSMQLLVGFGGLAAFLAACGIYGVLAFSVAQRMRELGTRIALGARRNDILGLVLRQGMLLAVLGVAVGLALSQMLVRFVESMLFGITAHDPATLLAVGIGLPLVALVACVHPALRATRIDPVIALREE